MNPFYHGVAVTGDGFCPRPELVSTLHKHIDSSQNCVIRGVRRIGKTSAVLEALRTHKKAKHIYVNCWGRLDLESLASAIYEAFLIHQQRKGLSIEKIIRAFAHLRPKVTLDPYSGEPTFSVDTSADTAKDPKSIERVLDTLAHEGEKCPLVVVLDEFQALLKLPGAEALLATMRGAIQLQSHVTYFYLGSTRNLMDQIFNSPDQPFYKSAAPVNVPPLERAVYTPYIKDKFATGNRSASAAALSAVFDAACDITGDVQQLCSEIWNFTSEGDTIEAETVPHGLERIHRADHESNSRIIELLTPGQIRVLVGLARVGGVAPTSKEFLAASGIAQPSSVTRALNRLASRGLIYSSPKGYQFFSPFFRTWLLTQEL
jgi:hypothetical protein